MVIYDTAMINDFGKTSLCTTIYEKSFREFLKGDHIFFKIESPSIFSKIVIINNVKDESREELSRLIHRFEEKIKFVDHTDLKKDALEKYQCNLSEHEVSYWYSIQYFCQMLAAEKSGCNYIFNIGVDCNLSSDNIDDYILDSIKLLDAEKKVLLTTLPWSDLDFEETGIHEQNLHGILDRNDLFWFSKVVSDQVFMVKLDKLSGGIFNIKENLHPFPPYGGDSFEKRFCNHLIKNDFLRAIYKKHYYLHKSY